jgi:long-chain acyl-CoA synthetase
VSDDNIAINFGDSVYKWAQSAPNREALVWEGRRLTYSQLYVEASSVANQLLTAGMRPDDRVALLGRNSVDYVVSLVGVQLAGLTLTPLNWRLPIASQLEMIRHLTPRAMLHSAEWENIAAAALSDGIVEVAFPLGPIASRSSLQANRGPRSELAAIISTGGTEGIAKGVELTHTNFSVAALNFMAAVRPSTSDVFLVLPQMFHNPQLYVLPHLFLGAKLVVPQLGNFDVETLLDVMAAEGVTSTLLVATMVNLLLETDPGQRAQTLRAISYGGSGFSESTLRRATEMFGCDFYQLYGQTETSILVSVLNAEDHRLALTDPESRHLLRSCGREVPLISAMVVDEEDRPVPQDGKAIGEIVARGPSVMRGYWQKPELTAETLKGGWCHTGDLGTWDSKGYFSIADRKKETIRSGGENVFPAVIEKALQYHPAVLEVAVIGIPDPKWGELVTAVVVLRPGTSVTPEELIAHCRTSLGGYMLPKRFEFVSDLPKNPSGKILKQELRKAYWDDNRRQVGVL